MRTVRPRISLFAVLALTLAAVGAGGATAAPAQAAGDAGKLLLVLDSSGSMAEPAGDGRSKIDAAKSALNAVIDSLDDQAQVGMRVYGSSVHDKADPAACTDSKLVVPIAAGNKAQLKSQVASYTPTGWTPISYSLGEAGKDVGTVGKRSILLLSDGEETCVPDPCPVAAQLAAQGIDLRIDVVGLKVSGLAQQQLKCIAEKGRGTYYDAQNTQQLLDSLRQVKERALRPFEVTGTPVVGASTDASAPDIGVGRWTDAAPGPEAVRSYRLKRTTPKSTFWVGVSTRPDKPRGALELALHPEGPGATSCNNVSYPFTLDTGLGSKSLLTGATNSWARDPSEECVRADLILTIRQPPSARSDIAATPLQIDVVEEPPVSGTSGLPGQADDPTWQVVPASGNPQAVTGGNSLANAPTITPGVKTFDMVPGEIQFFRVNLDFGQRLQAHATAARVPTYRDGLRRFAVDLLSPLGGSVRSFVVRDRPAPRKGGIPVDEEDWLGSDEAEVLATTKEVRFLNRDSITEENVSASRPGSYLIAISLQRQTPQDPSVPVPVSLQVDLVGKAGTGAPPYVQNAPAATPAPTPGTPAAATATAAPAAPDAPDAAQPDRDVRPEWRTDGDP